MPAMKFAINTVRLFTGVVLLLMAAYAWAQESLVEGELKHNVYISGPNILLGDIATLNHENKELLKILSKLEMMKSPRIGYIDVYRLEDIRSMLLKKHPQWYEKILWLPAGKVQVHARGRTLPYKDIAKQAEKYFIRQLDNDRREISISLSGNKDNIKLPYGELKYIPRMNTTFVSKKMCVWMDAYINEVFYRSVPVWMTVDIREKVYMAKYNIQDRMSVIEDDFELVEQNITDFSAQHIIAGQFDKPLLLNKAIKKGEVLLGNNVKQLPSVIGGQKVNIRVSEGGVRIQIQGIAQRDAEIGDVLKIKPLHSDQFIKARVIGKQLVEVI